MRTMLFVSCLLVIASGAVADPFVRCVQKQLTALSVDVGSIDGLMGRKTRNGIEDLKQREESIAGFPPLSKENASFWCRETANRFGLKSHWPSQEIPLEIITQDTVSEGKTRLIARTAKAAYLFLQDSLDMDVPDTITIIASTDMPHVTEKLFDVLDGIDTRSAIRRQMQRQCKVKGHISAVSYGGAVALCPYEHLGDTGKWTENDNQWLKRILVHEMAHEFATQYIGNYRKSGVAFRDIQRGPKWLFEGSAIALELSFAVPGLSMAQQAKWFEARMKFSGQKLRTLSPYDATRDGNFQMYAGYAGVSLASEFGLSAFGIFWANIPRVGWEDAFEIAFGQTVEGFYDNFGA